MMHIYNDIIERNDGESENNIIRGESGTTGDTQDGTGTSTYVVDPNTGELIDPATGQPAECAVIEKPSGSY